MQWIWLSIVIVLGCAPLYASAAPVSPYTSEPIWRKELSSRQSRYASMMC